MEVDEITEKTIGCAHEVVNTLGSGFVEKVYENIEIRRFVPYDVWKQNKPVITRRIHS